MAIGVVHIDRQSSLFDARLGQFADGRMSAHL
jgi:hypothetical protein